MRIWDLHFHGFENMEEMKPYIDRMRIERLFSLDIGGWGDDPETRKEEARDRQLLEKWRDLVAGIIRIDPSRPEATLEKMDRWIANGPAVGIKYILSENGHVTCAHPDNDPIIEKAREMGVVIYIHTWIKVGGDPRYPGGGNLQGESTPSDVAELASRFPDVPMICGHSGGDWELGVRAIRPHENVFFEFSGGDPWSTACDFAVDELGIDRIVWGGHLSSRSYATELAKIYDADLTDAERKKALGGNLRRLAAPIMREKGYTVEV
jgi:predicted TIM-barrel fold metal-dependent hydrolase